jgi:23S rRNA (guanine1835-N2)-methyltransferase
VTPFDPLDLRRWPPRSDDPLRAWDGADRYLLEALDERGVDGEILVVDDAWGALACCLAGRVRSWGDSELGRLALDGNRERNGLPDIPWAPMTGPPPGDPPAAVLVRLPRSRRRLRHLLHGLAPHLAPGATVLLGARSRDVQQGDVAVVDAAIGPAVSTRARHKARLIVAERDERSPPPPPPRTWEAAPGLLVRGLPGVFGAEKLDRGTALLLAALPEIPSGAAVVDLGCGAGPIGLVAASRCPTASLLFCDESWLAVASARRSFEAAGLPNAARFVVADALSGEPDRAADLVLCNPPFHQGQTLSRRVAAHMFAESARVLRPGGALLVVGNRNLGYHVGLRRHFGAVEVVRSDPRFVVLHAREPGGRVDG